jgi:hypothetical protein
VPGAAEGGRCSRAPRHRLGDARLQIDNEFPAPFVLDRQRAVGLGGHGFEEPVLHIAFALRIANVVMPLQGPQGLATGIVDGGSRPSARSQRSGHFAPARGAYRQ